MSIQAFTPANRRSIEDEIERLIALLDQIDSDPDLEPWLAGELAPGDIGDDREEECEDEGAQCDDEGHIESGIADHDALELWSGLNGLGDDGLRFNRSGQRIARDMLATARVRQMIRQAGG